MLKPVIATALLATSVIAIAARHDVPRHVEPKERAAARKLLNIPRPTATRNMSFTEQVGFIAAVQSKVLSTAALDAPIPLGRPRELSDLVQAGHGLCYDRSRAIETLLRVAGFEVRHAAVYSTARTHSALRSILTPKVPSHSLSEVKTSRGWMAVDSNVPWIGLTSDGAPVGLAELPRPHERWNSLAKSSPTPILQKNFTWIYGLYSRHGNFYPPYNPVPDVNWLELSHNLGLK